MNSWPPKDPNEVLDYQMLWQDVLQDAETITASDFFVESGSVTLSSEAFLAAGTTTVWISGGTEGEICVITNRITTSGGRTYDESARLRIRSK